MLLHVADTAAGSSGGRNGSHIRDFCLDGSLPQITVIVDAFLAGWGVDDQVDLSVGDQMCIRDRVRMISGKRLYNRL